VPVEVVEAFNIWKKEHNKMYSSPTEAVYRIKLFYQNWVKVNAHNQANESWKMGVNFFSDMTIEEIRPKYFGRKKTSPEDIKVDYTLLTKEVPANDVNWVTAGAVTPVKNQKQCGSCWAFSSTGALEGLDFIHNNLTKVNSYSEQQLVDCSRSYGNEGCDGGDMPLAFKYVHDHGITTEQEYPYKGIDQKCKSKVGEFKISSYKHVPPKSSGALINALTAQPVSMSIDADGIMNYKNGIFADTKCGTDLNHGVLVTGFDADAWHVKNSWGTSWGEAGYIRISRSAVPDTKGGVCGILLDNSFPILN